MKYKVTEVYTPDDPALDRYRNQFEFESDQTGLYELAFEACKACRPQPVSEETLENIRRRLQFDDVRGQLQEQVREGFDFTLWGNSGEWNITVIQSH